MFKKKSTYSFISVFMAVLMILMSVAISAEEIKLEKITTENKITDELRIKLDNSEDDDLIAVSVWFSDIDYTSVRSEVENDLAKGSSVSNKAVELVFSNESADSIEAQATLSELNEIYKDVTVEEVQYVIEKERNTVTDIYQSHNRQILNSIFEDDSAATFLFADNLDSVSNSKILYVSRYAPNVEMRLTKAEILEMSENDYVEEINYIETDNSVAITPAGVTYDDDEEPKDMTFFDVTGLSTMRDAWGFNGLNMKVGMVEPNGHPRTSLETPGTITRVYAPEGSFSNHATLVADIMLGLTTTESGTVLFEGAIPYADLYTASITNYLEIKEAVEALLDEGVTAINCSFSYHTNNTANNVYGDIAKWYDHISVQHNVHLILTSSNEGALGVPCTNTSYNAIVVGACDNNGTILSSSSYIVLNNFMNKPDIVAPGDNIASINYGNSGTSFAAPMVTSAVIQLSQASPVLMTNPTLMKAVLLGNAKITADMSNDTNVYSTVNGTTTAISQVYGAGMLNVAKAYTSFTSDSYYKTSTMPPVTSVASYQKNITKAKGKTLRFCLTWNKMNSVSDVHTTGTVTDAPLDNYKLTVITPSGDEYTSQNLYDNKQMISFVATENGTYTFRVAKIGTGGSGQVVKYSVAYSKQ